MRYLAEGKGLYAQKRTLKADVTHLNCAEWRAEGNMLYSASAIRSDRLPWLQTRELVMYKSTDTNVSNGFGYLGNKFYYVDSDALRYDGLQDSYSVGTGKKYFRHFGGKIYIFPNGTCFNPQTPAVTSLFRGVTDVTASVENYTKNGVDYGLSKLVCEAQSLGDIFYVGDCLRVTLKSSGGVSVHRVTGIDSSDGGLVLESMAFGSGVSFSAKMDITNGAVEGDCVGCVCAERLWMASGTHIYATGYGGGRWTDEKKCSFACEIENGESVVACEELNGYPVFFTEKSVYVMKGDNSSNYMLERCECRGGISSDLSHTLIRVLGCLYYATPHGLARFDGEKSALLEDVPFDISGNICVGTDSKNLFVSLSAGGYGDLYAYDIVQGQWKKTGIKGISYIFSDGERAYGYSIIGRIYKLSDGTGISGVGGYVSEQSIIYEAKYTFDIDGGKPYRIRIYGDIDANGSCTVSVSYDGGESCNVGLIKNDGAMHEVMLIPKGCHRLGVKLYGARSACIRGVYVDITE